MNKFLFKNKDFVSVLMIIIVVAVCLFVASTIIIYRKKLTNLSAELSTTKSELAELKKKEETDPELLRMYSKVYFLNEHYVPSSLTQIESKYLPVGSNPVSIHSSVYPYLKKLIDSASDAGLTLRVESAYRSFPEQAKLKSSYKIIYGANTANSFVADQGYSEHQLGTAIDFTANTKAGVSSTTFEKTPEYEWLKNNAYKFGFTISYPKDNTYYRYEPWHWRFVGVELATKIHEENTYFYLLNQKLINTYLTKIFD